jgi:hypothetical protein
MFKDEHLMIDEDELTYLQKRLSVLSIVRAECERSFSCMNLMHIRKRNAWIDT